MQKSFSARLAALEALEAAQRPEAPPYIVIDADGIARRPDGSIYEGSVWAVKTYVIVSPNDWDPDAA